MPDCTNRGHVFCPLGHAELCDRERQNFVGHRAMFVAAARKASSSGRDCDLRLFDDFVENAFLPTPTPSPRWFIL